MPISTYSPSAGSNTALFPEGMSPSAVNDGMRQVQADIRQFYENIEWRDMGLAPTFLTSTSFSVINDKTQFFTAGRRMRLSGSGMVDVYATITNSTFASGNTTVTFTVDSGTVNNTINTVYLGLNPANKPFSTEPSNGTKGDVTVNGSDWAVKQIRSLTGPVNEGLINLASSATPDIWSATNIINYTGVVTTTGFPNAPQAGARRTLVCAGAVTFVNSANMLIDGGADYTTTPGDRINVIALTTSQFRLEIVKALPVIPIVLPVVGTFTGDIQTGTTPIPWDDTIPQNNEGNEYITFTHTPKKATSTLVIDWQLNLSNNASSGHLTSALFKDTDVSAIKASIVTFSGAGFQYLLSGRHIMQAGSTTPITFRVRAGGSAGGTTTTLNGSGGVRKLGGIENSFLTVTEYTTL